MFRFGEGELTTVPMSQAGLEPPFLAFPTDDDPFPFAGVGLLIGKLGWWADQDRHVGVEIVDSAEKRWVVSGLVEVAPAKRRWWGLGKPSAPEWDIEVRPLDSEPFEATRQRVELQASRIFEGGDDALAQIRSANSLADLGEACLHHITIRAQGCRILAGDLAIPIRPPADVARRALILFALVRISLKADRIKTMEWLSDKGLIEAITPAEPPLFTSLRLSDEQRSEAGWNVEGLAALSWALGYMDMPAPGEFADISAIADIMPPSADVDVERFVSNAALRPPRALAQMAEACREAMLRAEQAYRETPSSECANAAEAAGRRYMAIQWITNPDRLEWA